MELGIARLALTVLVSGGLSVAGFGLAVGTAQAEPPTQTWCPGQPMPQQDPSHPLVWDMSVCHDWYEWHEGTHGYPVEGEYPNQLHGRL
jgi:hypothetical protein